MAKIDLTKIKALAAAAAETGPDLNKQGGGDYKPPEKGRTRLRFIEYVETGVHTTGREGSTYGQKTKPRAQFGFELSGPKHPAKVIEGKTYPHIIRFDLAIGQNKKSDYSKLFKLMVKDFPGRKNFAQLLGEPFLGEVIHREWKSAAGDTRVSADLKNGDAGFTVSSVHYEDIEGNALVAKVDAAISDLRLFLWDYADTDQWDSVFIDGTYDDGNTKNKVQEKIKAAENFEGSPIYLALQEAGRDAELEPAPVHERGEQQDKQDVPVTAADEAADEPEAEEADAPVVEEQQEPEVEVDEEAELLAQMAALKAKKAAAAKAKAAPVKEAPKKAPAKPVAAPKAAAKAKVAKAGDDPLQGL